MAGPNDAQSRKATPRMLVLRGDGGAEPMDSQRIEAVRVIDAQADVIFAVIIDPDLHSVIDGSAMVQGAKTHDLITGVGQTFISTMHRMGRDYEMINHVVEFEPSRCLAWAPAPGDLDTAGGKAENIGVSSWIPVGLRA